MPPFLKATLSIVQSEGERGESSASAVSHHECAEVVDLLEFEAVRKSR